MRKKKKGKPKPREKANNHGHSGNRPKQVVLQTLANSGWVQNTSIAALGIITAAICAIMKMSLFKTTVVTACVVLTALVWIVGVTIIRAYEKPSNDGLSIRVNNSMLASDLPCWWLRYRSSLGDTISPMPIMLNASITNVQDVPITLDSISVSAQLNDDPWVKFKYVNTRAGDVYWMYGGALNDAGLLDLSGNGLDRLLVNPIDAHKTVRGLIFFDTERPFVATSGDKIRYRWAVQDSTGQKYETTSEFEPINTQAKTPDNATFSGMALKFSAAHIDLRGAGLKVKRWNEAITSVPNK
jgi:hypothetical protein